MIETEFLAQKKFMQYNLFANKKLLLHGISGCGKTLAAEKLAIALNLKLLKISYFEKESIQKLKTILEFCKKQQMVVLFEKYHLQPNSILLTLLEKYSYNGIIVVTTTQKTIEAALFNSFDEIIKILLPTKTEIKELFSMTLLTTNIEENLQSEDWEYICRKDAQRLERHLFFGTNGKRCKKV